MENRKTLVGDDFSVPTSLVTGCFFLSLLTIHYLGKDYDAVISSEDRLKRTFSRISGSDWPNGLTLEANLIDLGWHQREFTLRYSFTYTVISPEKLSCLGCVSINPSPKIGYDATVSMRVRASRTS